MTLQQLSEKTGVKPETILKRIQRHAAKSKDEDFGFKTYYAKAEEMPEELISALFPPEQSQLDEANPIPLPAPTKEKSTAKPAPKPAPKPAVRTKTFLAGFTLSAVLPVMGVPAAYGVYKYVSYFSPGWVAGVYCTGFELVYISVALQKSLSADTIRKARALSIAAFMLSVIYNVFADIIRVEFGGNIMNCDYWLRILLYVLHGAAAPIISYFYAVIMINR